MYFKGFGLIGMFIVVAIGVLLAGGGFYFFKQQRQKSNLQVGTEAVQQAQNLKNQLETANWQIYRNDFYQFEFRYPLNGEIRSSEGGLGFVLDGKSAFFIDPNYEYEGRVPENIYNGQNKEKIVFQEDCRLVNLNELAIWDCLLNAQRIIIFKTPTVNNYILEIRNILEGNIFNQILSTFKFIPSAGSTSSPQAGSGQVK